MRHVAKEVVIRPVLQHQHHDVLDIRHWPHPVPNPLTPATLRGSDPRARVKCYSSRLTAVAGWDDRKASGCRALTERGHEDCLDRVQAVLGLVEHDAGGGPPKPPRPLPPRGASGGVP